MAVAAWVAKQNASSPPALDAEQALAVFRPLHANIYRAFDYDTESDVYDALERVVEGKLLDRLYDEIYTDLVLADDGARSARSPPWISWSPRSRRPRRRMWQRWMPGLRAAPST